MLTRLEERRAIVEAFDKAKAAADDVNKVPEVIAARAAHDAARIAEKLLAPTERVFVPPERLPPKQISWLEGMA